ncbi:MAG: replicative DNA helicase [Planctomycetes bacterium]|nr:replicative DNA helicase [Planctomycetota bacterium]
MSPTNNYIPQHVEAEKAVLGAMMIHENIYDESLVTLKPEDFFLPAHQKIYRAIQTLTSEGIPSDQLSVENQLGKLKELEGVGGSDYLFLLTSTIPSQSGVGHYSRIIKEKSRLRRLIAATHEIRESATMKEDFMASMELAEARLTSLSDESVRKSSEKIDNIMQKVVSGYESRSRGDNSSLGIQTHFHDLGRIVGGFRPDELIIIAARPSMGKTTFALNLMTDFAMRGVPCMLFSLETPKEQLVSNMVCSRALIDGNVWKNRTKDLKPEEISRLKRCFGDLAEAPIFIDDDPVLTPVVLRTKLRRYHREQHLGAVFIDYLQLMSAPEISSREGRTQEISHISRSVKALARDLKIPIFALAQLSRGVEHRVGNKPKMADLRESGSIEQDADLIMLLFRPEYYDEKERPGEADVIIAKHRNGPTGTTSLRFLSNMMRFENMAKE